MIWEKFPSKSVGPNNTQVKEIVFSFGTDATALSIGSHETPHGALQAYSLANFVLFLLD